MALQRTAGNAAVGRLLARKAAHPMEKQLEVAEGVNEGGTLDIVEQSIMKDLTKSDNKLRKTQLGYLRAVQAFQLSPRYRARLQKPTAPMSQTEMDKLIERRWLEGTVATAGSLRLGFERASKSKSPHNAEQTQLLRGDIKDVQDEFVSRLKSNTDEFLDDSEARIASVLQSYGLVIAAADSAVKTVFLYESELDKEVDEWLERAKLGHKATYESKATKRSELAKTTEHLRTLQARVLKLQVAYMDATFKVPLDEADRRRADKQDKGRDPLTNALFGNVVTPAQRVKEEEIQKAGQALSTAWLKAERAHPILAAHRDGQQRHLELIDLTSYGGNFSPSGLDFLDDVKIRQAYRRVIQKGAQSTERAVVKQALRKLVNIHRTRLAIRQGKLSRYKLKPVVEFTRRQLLIHPKSVWGVAVDELVSPHKGPLDQALDFVKDIFNIALMVLAVIPNPLQPVAALYDVARGSYITLDEYVKYDLQTAYSDTDLDKARSISDEEPSLTGFLVSLLATGMGVVQARSVFKAAAAARRSMLAGDDAARKTLNELGKTHGVGPLGDDIANEAGIATGGAKRTTGGGGKPTTTGEPKPLPTSEPKPAPTSEPKPTPEPKPKPTGGADPHPSGGTTKAADPPKVPRPHTSLTDDELKALVHYKSADQVEQGVLPSLRGMGHGTVNPNLEMQELETLISAMPKTPNNQRLLAVYKKYYGTIRDPKKHAEFMAQIWHQASARKVPISTLDALEELVARGAKPHIVADDLVKADLLHDAPFIDMAFNGAPHGTHTHMYLEGLIDFHHGVGKGKELRHLIANATGPPIKGGARQREFFEKFWDGMWDEYSSLQINSPEGLQPLLEKHLGFPRKIPKR